MTDINDEMARQTNEQNAAELRATNATLRVTIAELTSERDALRSVVLEQVTNLEVEHSLCDRANPLALALHLTACALRAALEQSNG